MTESFAWLDADGALFQLDGFALGVEVLDGVKGRGAPPVRVERETIPGRAGERRRATQHAIRTLELPLMFAGDDEPEAAAVVEQWLTRLDPTRGDGRLRITSHAGTTREVICRYASGLELEEVLGSSRFAGKYLATLVLEADYPYWLDSSDTAATWDTAAPVTWFPWPPLRLSSAAIYAGQTITVGGAVDASPLWTVHGPGTGLRVTHTNTGRTFSWNGELGPGDVLTIDTRRTPLSSDPRAVRVNGVNAYSLLGDRDLFPFVPGTQTVNVELTATDVSTTVAASWRAQYLKG